MKTTKEKRKNQEISPEEAIKQLQKLFKERGTKALEMARKEMLQEKIECKEAREAVKYFMTEYWNDLVRPTLLSLVCEAVGGDPEQTTPIAVPLILISGAIDIHDDIIDQSKTKHGRPTVYGKFGSDIALIVGDMLLIKGLTLLNKAFTNGISPEKMAAICNIIQAMFIELGDAEALELGFRRCMDVTPKEYLHMIQKKAADVEAHTKISAIIGNGSKKEIEAIGRYGRLLGMVKLLRDDSIDLIDPKELVHRIERECLPYPLLYALQNSKISPKIKSILAKKLTRVDTEAIVNLTYVGGGFELSEKSIRGLATKCLNSLSILNYKKELKLFVISLLQPLIE
jgi:geranylgeranyl pyrophosphate synthase